MAVGSCGQIAVDVASVLRYATHLEFRDIEDWLLPIYVPFSTKCLESCTLVLLQIAKTNALVVLFYHERVQ